MSASQTPLGQPASRPGYAAGLFFLVWAALGWYGIFSNAPLIDSFGAQSLDPGPAILPIMVCTGLTAGGLWLLVTGLIARNPGYDRVPSRMLAVPALFLLSALLTALLIGFAGFRGPAFLFAAVWLIVLNGRQPVWWKRIVHSLVLAAVIVGFIQFVFVTLLRVPLP